MRMMSLDRRWDNEERDGAAHQLNMSYCILIKFKKGNTRFKGILDAIAIWKIHY
jgi:hypothetical protein